MTAEQEILRIEAIGHQAWGAWEQRLPDIERIAESGPNGSEDDTYIVQGVFSAVVGDIIMRMHKRSLLEENPDATEPGR